MSGCKAGALLEGHLADEDTTTLARLLESSVDLLGRQVPASVLSRGLAAIGHPVSPTTIKDHRASRCACARKA